MHFRLNYGKLCVAGLFLLSVLACPQPSSGPLSSIKVIPKLGLNVKSFADYQLKQEFNSDGSTVEKAIKLTGVALDRKLDLKKLFDGENPIFEKIDLGSTGGELAQHTLTPGTAGQKMVVKVTDREQLLFVEFSFGLPWHVSELTSLSIDGSVLRSVVEKNGAANTYVARVNPFHIPAHSFFSPTKVKGLGGEVRVAEVLDPTADSLGSIGVVSRSGQRYANLASDDVFIEDKTFSLKVERSGYEDIILEVQVRKEALTPAHSLFTAVKFAGQVLDVRHIEEQGAQGEAELRSGKGWAIDALALDSPGELAFPVTGLPRGWTVSLAAQQVDNLVTAVEGVGLKEAGLDAGAHRVGSTPDLQPFTLQNSSSSVADLTGRNLLVQFSHELYLPLSLSVTLKASRIWSVADVKGVKLSPPGLKIGHVVLDPKNPTAHAELSPPAAEIAAGATLDLFVADQGNSGVSVVADSFSLAGLTEPVPHLSSAGLLGDGPNAVSPAALTGKSFKLTLRKDNAQDLEVTFTFGGVQEFTADNLLGYTLGGKTLSSIDVVAKTAVLEGIRLGVSQDFSLGLGGTPTTPVPGMKAFLSEKVADSLKDAPSGIAGVTFLQGTVGRYHNKNRYDVALGGKKFTLIFRAPDYSDCQLVVTIAESLFETGDLDGTVLTASRMRVSSFTVAADASRAEAVIAIPESITPPLKLAVFTENPLNIEITNFQLDVSNDPNKVEEDEFFTTVMNSAGDMAMSIAEDWNLAGKKFKASISKPGFRSLSVVFSFPKFRFDLPTVEGFILDGSGISRFTLNPSGTEATASLAGPTKTSFIFSSLARPKGASLPPGFTLSGFTMDIDGDSVEDSNEFTSSQLAADRRTLKVDRRIDFKGKTFQVTLDGGIYYQEKLKINFTFPDTLDFTAKEIESVRLAGLALKDVSISRGTAKLALPANMGAGTELALHTVTLADWNSGTAGDQFAFTAPPLVDNFQDSSDAARAMSSAVGVASFTDGVIRAGVDGITAAHLSGKVFTVRLSHPDYHSKDLRITFQ